MKTNIKNAVITVLIATLGGIIALFINSFANKNNNKTIVVKEPYPQVVNARYAENATPDFTEAAQKTINAVVHVKTVYIHEEYISENPLFDFFFGGKDTYQYSPQPVLASGSGVIISEDGYIITNNHVIKDSKSIEVVLNDKRTYKAKIIGTDPTTDIALIKIDEEGLPFLPYGDSDNLKVGEWVLAVGNPFNLTSTVTAGIVSAKGRNIDAFNKQTAIESFIQTDAAVNPGNSGGALVTKDGVLIGINTAIASRTGYFSGYSFAVPVNLARKVVEDIKEYGIVQRAWLGVTIMDIDAKLAEDHELGTTEGVYVEGVLEGGAAENAGIKPSDVILKIEDIVVNQVSELQEQIGKYRPGVKINITVKRKNEKLVIPTTLRNRHGSTEIIKNPEMFDILGASFHEVTNRDKENYEVEYGIKVTDLIPGKLQSAGIKEDFVMTHINRKPVKTVKDLEMVLLNSRGGIYIEGVYPDKSTAYYAFGMK